MAHMTVAASEKAFQLVFERARDSFAISKSDSGSWGPFTASYSAGVKLAGGEVDLQADGTVRIKELDIVYDPLSLNLGINIPEVVIGGFCIFWVPIKGCVVRAPRWTLFSANPDISIPLDLSGLIQSEVSGSFKILTKNEVDPNRLATMTDLDAEDAGVPDKWNIYLDPVWMDIDLIDIADTVGNILDAAIENAVDNLLGWLPGWAKDAIEWILGSIVDLVRAALDLVDDIDEWLSNLLGVSFGLFDFVLTMVADYFASKFPIFGIEDPYPILGYSGALIPVKIPIAQFAVVVDDKEMIITADIGA